MKKFLLFSFCLFCCVSAHSWALLENIDQARDNGFFKKLFSYQPVHVCIDVQDWDYNKNQPKSYRGKDVFSYEIDSEQVVSTSYERWFSALRNTIVKQERQGEFRDVLSVLPSYAPFDFVTYNLTKEECSTQTRSKVDLRVRATLYNERSFYSPDSRGEKTRAAYSFYLQPEFLGLPHTSVKGQNGSHHTSLYISMHEAGHTLGLADLYEGERKENFHPLHSTAKYRPFLETNAIMNGKPSIQCDDIDGLLNAMDVQIPEEMGARRTEGWVSFCPNSRIAYAYGIPFEITPEERTAYFAWVITKTAIEAKNARRKKNKEPVPSSPLEGKVADVKAKLAQYKNSQAEAAQKRAVAKAEEEQRTQEAIAREEMRRQLASAAYQAAPKVPNICPICGKRLLGAGKKPVKYSNKEKTESIYVHRECAPENVTRSWVDNLMSTADKKFLFKGNAYIE